ncbi:MAG: hypothetical protein LBJ35_04040 [Spirochaetaceae bacterium]|nr:hypothetical protein [Spirochaetaceae bacterium]
MSILNRNDVKNCLKRKFYKNAGSSAAEFAGFFDESMSHQIVRFQEVVYGIGVKCHNLVVGFISVLYLLDFFLSSRD